MAISGPVYRRLRALFRRRQLERDLDDELAFHLAMRQTDNAARGLTAEEARVAARRQFGNVALLKERTRDAWQFPSLESGLQDLRFAYRSLQRAPGFTVMVALTLALAIAVATAMFTIVDALVLRPVPFRAPGQLAFVHMGNEHGGRTTVAPAVLRAWRESPAFIGAESAAPHTALIQRGDAVVSRPMADVTPGMFDLLGGVQPLRGRLFGAGDGRPGADDRVLLSEELWRGVYDADPGIIGSRLTIDAQPHVVIGIVPSDFRFPAWNTAIWRATSLESRDPSGAPARAMAYVRFAPGLPRPDALRLATDSARAVDPETAELSPIVRGVAGVSRNVERQQAIPLLAGAVVLVFIALCANVGSLLLARLTSRRHQFSVCSALGASRGRVMRQASAESALLGLLAVAIGVAGAWTLVALARRFLPDAWLLATLNPVNIDRRALAVASLAGILATLAAGLLPAWIGTRVNAGDSLRLTDRTGSESRGSRSLTRALLIGELALACTLLVGATLLVRTFVNLTRADRGLDANGVLTATMSLPRTAFDTAAARSAAATTAERAIQTLPGVDVTAWSFGLPPGGGGLSFGVWHSDDPKGPAIDITVERYDVGPDFFALYGIPVLRGRTFQPADSEQAVVIGERLARLLWPNQDAIGRTYTFLDSRFEVIGVAREIALPSIDATHDRPEFYQRFRGIGGYAMLSVRCAGPCPSSAIVRQRIMAAVPAIQVNEVRLLEDAYDEELARPRATAALGGAFAGIAILAAAAGLFSLLSYTAVRRRKEFGIRTALGASARQVGWLVFRDGLIVTFAGMALGTVGAWMLSRNIGSLRYGVTVGDPVSWALVVGLLTATTLVAAWRPARLAARVDPVLLLRQE